MTLSAQLDADFAQFDGRALSILSEIHVRYKDMPGYWDDIAARFSAPDDTTQSGATWIWLDHLKTGHPSHVIPAQTIALHLPHISYWSAILHILQGLDKIDLPDDSHSAFHTFIQPNLSHKRPFIRAWALHALCVLAQQNASYTTAAQTALAQARNDPAASVKARAKQTAKLLDSFTN
jgi:hypothetical protein